VFGYGLVLAHLEILDVAGARAWIASASHGIERNGVPRVVFGLARSWIDMGDDGVIFKRYLMHDSLNPVSWNELLHVSIWKLGLFYLGCGALLLNLLYSGRGRNVFALLGLNALPVVLFAISWTGSDVERYLPLCPMLFLALGFSLVLEGTKNWLKAITVAFVVVASATNLVALSGSVVDGYSERVVSRVRQLLPEFTRGSLLLVLPGDELLNFKNSFPFHPINRQGPLKVSPMVRTHNAHTLSWPQRCAGLIQKTWHAGADVWISRRLLAARPRPEWGWVEGDDPRLSWTDLYRFTAQLELGGSIGGEDGFAMLLRSLKNEEILGHISQPNQSTVSRNARSDNCNGPLLSVILCPCHIAQAPAVVPPLGCLGDS
jgi:hypothetical protein